MPTYSVILDARTAGAQLPRTLVAFDRAAGSWKDAHELLLVDDTGDRRLPDLAQRHHATLLPCTAATQGARLNAAVGASHGELLLFPGLVNRRVIDWLPEVEAERTWDAAVLPVQRQGRLLRWWNWLQRAASEDTYWVERAWFELIGGFDPQLDGDAPTDLLARLRACGARIWLASDDTVRHKTQCPSQDGHCRG
ncbi:hypothetical protein BZY95_14965 [Billgrantia desiderata SP1]|uniref:hypothetical protein n=2 Tax=Billgrantia desiderata TaxID=52021 RepID=UPI000A36F1C7|nr:hypothetical protein [Halomonas desiderata]OUE40047.1 hypothetical protein BZY95_14965 [Halomonas desiderata SP1]